MQNRVLRLTFLNHFFYKSKYMHVSDICIGSGSIIFSRCKGNSNYVEIHLFTIFETIESINNTKQYE